MPLSITTKHALAERYARIYAYLRQNGRPIPTNDLWIAASAMEHSVELLTADAHFSASFSRGRYPINTSIYMSLKFLK